ncbi:hypothetical protein KIN20_002957 [Parelaphostrongylus tenuis]|uniref:Uncharacterized protein n=1 Tax=Parelaphostrongylus tenuis TaxID=148309 RepID=A0AAD5MHK0_PARTN|nr:hypothetical protein KIN20_002957 [Parelaphostrongylus tenuis]
MHRPPSGTSTMQRQTQAFLSRQTALGFFAEFRSCNTNLKNQLLSGRPRETNRETVIEETEEVPTLTIEELADDFDFDHAAINRIKIVNQG